MFIQRNILPYLIIIFGIFVLIFKIQILKHGTRKKWNILFISSTCESNNEICLEGLKTLWKVIFVGALLAFILMLSFQTKWRNRRRMRVKKLLIQNWTSLSSSCEDWIWSWDWLKINIQWFKIDFLNTKVYFSVQTSSSYSHAKMEIVNFSTHWISMKMERT